MAFVKLFGSLLDSTVWQAPLPAKVTWITMLAMSNRDGLVEARATGIARRAGVTIEECQQALAIFSAPDPESRSQEHDGRRAVEVADGWQLLNYEKYRDMASAEDKREKDAARQRRKYARDKKKAEQAAETSRSPHAPHVSSPLISGSGSSQINSEEREEGGPIGEPRTPEAKLWHAWETVSGAPQGDRHAALRRLKQVWPACEARDRADPVAVFTRAARTFRDDANVKRKKLGLAVLCSQFGDWADVKREKTPEERKAYDDDIRRRAGL